MKLHQLLAILPKIKADSAKAKTALYHNIQKTPELFKGLSRTYEPREDDGFVYPSESKAVQLNAKKILEQFADACTELFDTAAMQDHANTDAKAAVEVDGRIILENVPVANLLFLEKQLTDIKAFAQMLPSLDADQSWTYDSNRGVYVTEGKQSVKTKKVMKAVVLYEATKEHPAQVKEASEDVVEGVWTTIQFSSALPQDEINQLLSRIDKLIKAVITAREKANGLEVQQQSVAAPIFSYLFGNLLQSG
jgi:hypothetical protein